MNEKQKQLHELQQKIVLLQNVLHWFRLPADKVMEIQEEIEMLAVKCSEIGEQIYGNRQE